MIKTQGGERMRARVREEEEENSVTEEKFRGGNTIKRSYKDK